MSLTLVLLLKHRANLGTRMHQFFLGQHTSAAYKVLKDRVDQHQVIAGGGSAPTLADAAYLTAPDKVTLSETLAMAQSTHARLRVVLDTLLLRDQPAEQGMKAVVLELL